MFLTAIKVLSAAAIVGLIAAVAGALIRRFAASEMRMANRMAMVIPFSGGAEDMEFTVRSARRLARGCCEIVLLDCGGTDASSLICEKLAHDGDGICVVSAEGFERYIEGKL